MSRVHKRKVKHLQPFLKWAGGKRQLLPILRNYFPTTFDTYYEPFVGAGAVLFDLAPKTAIINDVNEQLVNVYRSIKTDVDALLHLLDEHTLNHNKDYYYKVREWDRIDKIYTMTNIERAARILYLNKTCFNGLYRVNSKGQFNVPFGKYKLPNIVNEKVLRSVNTYLNQHQVTITNDDFAETVSDAKKGDFVYFDPPYVPINRTSSFTGYSKTGFGMDEQERLRDVFINLAERGCHIILSNSYTPYIRELYRDFRIETVQASRIINSKGNSRGKIFEAVILFDGNN
ncbi:DNA adenine methylase [Bacillus solimangrovi]|uniref:Site-specific DNA-methyltransferase (adenine-specific) n=1 Tax=Bacillus solimangrovi TaxID=1305675 RepID=A0A1E5LJ51_9BACI|nr:DNA adenine methylase [Bacillus solimangrovi]OEH94058.1 DNA methyltransferase [Bacillus solimangrovi]